jgi:OOP family OmpA-OmpF porin
VSAIIGAGLVAGCAPLGLEYAPKGPYLAYPTELPAAERAVEAARAAGKDRECPREFQAVEKAVNEAYAVYWACRTGEAIWLANNATGRAKALCPKAEAAPAPPAPKPAAPTVTFSADPATIQAGKCTTLRWSATNATEATIDSGVGKVPASGSREVCPKSNIGYQITAKGPGGVARQTTVVLVQAAPPAPKRAEELTLYINFDTNKAEIRKADLPELQKAVEFVKRHPNRRIVIEGHTDSTGDAPYNQRLSERRAAAVKAYLVQSGIPGADRITAAGFGETKPVASNATANGRFLNRRVVIMGVPE